MVDNLQLTVSIKDVQRSAISSAPTINRHAAERNRFDFYDRLKSVSPGLRFLRLHLAGYRAADLVKLDVLVSGEPVDAAPQDRFFSRPAASRKLA